MFTSIVLSLLLGQPTLATQPTPTAVEVMFARVSTAEIIKHLPPADTEVVFRNSGMVENQYSVEFERRIEAGLITSSELGDAVKQCAVLRSSPKWFKHRPYAVWLRIPRWLPNHTIVATVTNIEGLKVSRANSFRGELCGNGIAEALASQAYQVLGPLPEGTTSVVLQVAVDFHSGGMRFGKKIHRKHPLPSWNGEIVLPVELIDETLPVADASEALTSAVKDATPIRMYGRAGGNQGFATFTSEFKRPPTGPLKQTSSSIQVEVLRDKTVVYSFRCEDPDEVDATTVAVGTPPPFKGELAREMLDAAQSEHFSVRIRGVKPTAPNRWCRTAYWSGEFTIPISEVARQ